MNYTALRLDNAQHNKRKYSNARADLQIITAASTSITVPVLPGLGRQMRQLNHKLNQYLSEYPIDKYFSFDIKPFLGLVEFSPDEIIFHYNSFVSELYYLIEGKAKHTLFVSNGKAFSNIIDAGGFIGETELLDTQEFSDEVKAHTLCVCYVFPLASCKNRILSDALFLRYLCSYISRNSLVNLLNYTRNQAFPLENRLAGYILDMAQGNHYTEKHTQAARYLGVSYRHFLHVISSFVENGILTKIHHDYLITDIERLRELAAELF